MTTQIHHYQKNIKLNYLFISVSRFNLTSGYWMIYLASKGLSLAWLGILEGIFHVTSLLMETPTGAVADILGRKFSRQLGVLVYVLFCLMMLFGSQRWHFIIAFVLCALSYNLESGAGEALIYDSLLANKRENEFMKVSGMNEVFFQGASGLGLVIGGYIAVLNYDMPFVIMIFVALLGFLISTKFKEVPLQNKVEKIHPIEAIKNQYKMSYNFMKNEKKILFFSIVLNIMGTFVLISFFYMQNYWKGLGVSEGTIGLLLALHSLCAAIGGYFAHKIEKKLGEKKLIILGATLLTIAYWLLYFKTLSFVVIVLMGFIDSTFYVVLSSYINHLIPSEQRATLLSFSSTIFSVFMIIFFPIVGYLGDEIGLSGAFMMLAVVLTLITTVIIYKLSKDQTNFSYDTKDKH
jgi:MFS family permease